MHSNQNLSPDKLWPVELQVSCSDTVFKNAPLQFDRWAPLDYLVGPNASGKTTFFSAIMTAARGAWPDARPAPRTTRRFSVSLEFS